jgi:hypothetical protein
VAVDDEGHLYVADWGDHRVLRFTAPHTSGMSADYVYGQRNPYDFTSAIPNNGGISPATLNGPLGLEWIERGWLLVTDNANQRVLRFQTGGARPCISADLAVSSQASPQSIFPSFWPGARRIAAQSIFGQRRRTGADFRRGPGLEPPGAL